LGVVLAGKIRRPAKSRLLSLRFKSKKVRPTWPASFLSLACICQKPSVFPPSFFPRTLFLLPRRTRQTRGIQTRFHFQNRTRMYIRLTEEPEIYSAVALAMNSAPTGNQYPFPPRPPPLMQFQNPKENAVSSIFQSEFSVGRCHAVRTQISRRQWLLPSGDAGPIFSTDLQKFIATISFYLKARLLSETGLAPRKYPVFAIFRPGTSFKRSACGESMCARRTRFLKIVKNCSAKLNLGTLARPHKNTKRNLN